MKKRVAQWAKEDNIQPRTARLWRDKAEKKGLISLELTGLGYLATTEEWQIIKGMKR